MRLVRNYSKDGYCKYAIIRLDRLRSLHFFNFILKLLKLFPKYIELGKKGSEEEVFVLKLKDINSRSALIAYSIQARKTRNEELALEVANLSRRAGDKSPFCKNPD